MATKTTKKKYSNEDWADQFEALYNLPKQTANAFTDEMQSSISNTWEQLLGYSEYSSENVKKLQGDLQEGKPLDVKALEQQKANAQDKAKEKKIEQLQPGLEYHREFQARHESRVYSENQQAMQQQIRQILSELRKLAATSKQLSVELKQVTMEETPEEVGKYHLTFFEWLLGVVQKARERVEESQTWLATFKSKKGQNGYWNMFKKHGTTFGMSNERNVATQTG